MQKISRVYLAGCGYRTAWYEGNILPLTDPVTNEPTDTILQLENGGGKTTLLSLIFSCFETEQNRFLKHLQGKHNRFSQYFDQTGAPGFIVVEWQMPPRTAGGYPYRLVVGQAVTVRNTTEPAEVDRLFFSFREQADLSLETLPTPNLAQEAAGSFAGFSRWIHEQHRRHPDVFTTRNQDEWKRHLKGERLIDLEMLQMQVSFSAQEGGFDAFVNFKGESEFLKKFFGLTLDQAKADEARRLVVQVCEKHARKPEFQRRRDELTKFRGTLNGFAEAARVYLDALRSEGAVMLQGVVLSQALQSRAAEFQGTIDQELAAEQAQRGIASTASREADALARALATVTHAWHRKRVAEAEAAKKSAEGAVQGLEAKGRHVRAARLQRDIKSSEKQIGDLEVLAEQERENLQPARDHVDFQGALFRRALFQEEERVSGVLQTLRDRAQNRETRRKEHQLLDAQAEREEMALAKEEAQLKAAEERREQRVASLVREGVLADAAELPSEAVDRWNREAQTHAATRDDFVTQKKNAKLTAAERRTAANRERKVAAELDAQAKSLQRYLADGEAERERLSQLPALLEAVESDTVDPFSPLLPQLLADLLSSCSRQIATVDVRLAELGLTKHGIDTTKVAGYSADVVQVVNVLREAGVRSALPFNEYIAKAVPDVQRARDLVMSDPARFLGVCVAKAEFETARAVDFGRRLPSKPVMVSVTALEPVATAGERRVIPSENDAAFNIAAAATLASEIAGKVAADIELRKALEARQLRAAKAVHDLESFLRTYGDGKLAKAAAEEQSAREDAQATAARVEVLETEAADFDSQADTLEVKARDADQKHRTSLETVRRLHEHVAEHERDRPGRLHRLGEMPALVAAVQEKRAVARGELERLQQEHADDAEKRASESAYHRRLGEERAALKYYDRAIDAVQQLQANPRPLEELRRLYKDAEENYLTDEKNRLGSLSTKIQSEHARKNEKTAEYIREFKDVTVDMFKPYLSVNHDEVLSDVETSLRSAREKAAKDSADHALAVKEAKKSDELDKALIDALTPEVIGLNLDELEQRRAEAGQKLSSAQERMVAAKQEADRAKSRADAKIQARGLDLTADNLVRKALGLGDAADLALTSAKFEAETGIHLDTAGVERPVLALQAADQVSALLSHLDVKRSGTKKHSASARKAFEHVKAAAGAKSFVEADADVAQQMVQNSFEDTCRDAERLLTHLDDRIKTTEDTLANMQADFDACIEEISEVVRNGILTLTKACSPDKRVPQAAPYIGGKQVLKMRADFGRINTEARRAIMRTYLDWLAESKVIPARGTDLVADAVSRVHGKPLGLQVLKMSIEETEQYVPVEKISNSGGEGVVMAMFLYLVINQLRAENYADVQKSAGGPLILDNPFAKATSAAMWRAQLMLAKEMNVQLIFATAIQDYNALGEFQRFVRLRKLQNTKTRRWHLEAANFTLTQAAAETMA